MHLRDLPTRRLRAALRATQAVAGEDSVSVQIIRRELIRRAQPARGRAAATRLRRAIEGKVDRGLV